MINYYLKIDEFNEYEQHSTFFKIVSQMPFEFFSASDQIIYSDKESLESSSMLIDFIGKENIYKIIISYFHDIF
jgi:hypothetical protein